MSDPIIRQLIPGDANAIVGLFNRVYGDSYANELFYDAPGISSLMHAGQLFCVGAIDRDQLIAHMAMNRTGELSTPELGNTVVDPDFRGGGLAWKVGAVLTELCRSRGHGGYLHFPTTDHHIMQRQSVKQGFETGLMLGYIPLETHGQVGEKNKTRRSAATIVYEPISKAPQRGQRVFVPGCYQALLHDIVGVSGMPRIVERCSAVNAGENSVADLKIMQRRGLLRLTFQRVAQNAVELIRQLVTAQLPGDLDVPCRQIDLRMDDPGIEFATREAQKQGFVFSGWLPGFLGVDVLRLQSVARSQTELAPSLENATAKKILAAIISEL